MRFPAEVVPSPASSEISRSRRPPQFAGISEHLGRESFEYPGIRQIDFGMDGPCRRQGPAESSLESEFEGRVEGQSIHHLIHGTPIAPFRVLPPRTDVGESISGKAGRKHPIAFRRVVPGQVDDSPGKRVEGAGIADCFGDDVPQGEHMGARLDESRTVGAVLDGVGEDERLLLMVVEVLVAEQRRQADGQESGDGGAEEADGIAFAAGRTVFAFRLLLGVRSLEAEHGEDVAGAEGFGQVVGNRGRPEHLLRIDEVPFPDVEGREVFVHVIDISTGEGILVRLSSGADERAVARVLRHRFPTDVRVFVGCRKLIADRGFDDSPAIAPAVAAVNRGEPLPGRIVIPCTSIIGDEMPVVRPREFGLPSGRAVDSRQGTDP
ncbi:hypothetical protein IOD13_09235 [Brevibacterium casei]|nr:hypothetical protein [Brevibacterium casei]